MQCLPRRLPRKETAYAAVTLKFRTDAYTLPARLSRLLCSGQGRHDSWWQTGLQPQGLSLPSHPFLSPPLPSPPAQISAHPQTYVVIPSPLPHRPLTAPSPRPHRSLTGPHTTASLLPQRSILRPSPLPQHPSALMHNLNVASSITFQVFGVAIERSTLGTCTETKPSELYISRYLCKKNSPVSTSHNSRTRPLSSNSQQYNSQLHFVELAPSVTIGT